MDSWHFTDEEKDTLARKLTKELPALRGAANASQDEMRRITPNATQYTVIACQQRWELTMKQAPMVKQRGLVSFCRLLPLLRRMSPLAA